MRLYALTELHDPRR